MTRDFDVRTESSFGGGDGSGHSSDDGGKPKRAGSKGTPQLVILLVLLALGGVVVAYQFLGGHSTKPADASGDAAKAAGAQAAGNSNQSGASAESQPGPNPAAGDKDGLSTLSVANVEDMAKRLDSYVQERQLPLKELHMNPFEVISATAAGDAAGAGSDTKGGITAEKPVLPTAPTVAVNQPEPAANDAVPELRPALKVRLTLGSVMIAGKKRMAIINGKLCHIGDVIEGCTVDVIEPAKVTLSRDGETVEASLTRIASGSKGN
jgi:hypothetical protein